MSRILVTPRSLTAAPDGALRALEGAGFELICSAPGRQPTEEELIALVPGCVGWLAGVEPITDRVLEAAQSLRIISRNGSGVDSIDLDAARKRGIKVRTAPGANAAAVAELTIAFMLLGLRRIPESAAALRAGEWRRVQGREIGGATIGLIGCGAIGRAVVRIVSALGASVLAYDVDPNPDFRPSRRFRWCGLDRVLAGSDVVSIHCPALPGGAALLDGPRLAGFKRGAGLINTARGSLVDEEELLAALKDGRVGWYATDVFAIEPPGASPLVAHERVFATPHLGGFTAEGGRRAVHVAVENLLEELAPAPNAEEEPLLA